jgi:hypothetical protein
MHPLDPQARYLLCRPQGGLNDTLVQLERCRRYAVRHGRALIVDLARSGLRLPFDEVFVAKADFGCPVICWTEEIAAELDGFASVRPAGLAGRVSSSRAQWRDGARAALDTQTGEIVSFDMARDHPERLLVHDQSGGGTRSIFALRRLALVPAIADAVAQRIVSLGPDYDAIHVRHTDLATDFRRVFDKCRPLFAGRRVLICSDSADVKRQARDAFGPGTVLLTASDTPDTGGANLHYSSDGDPVAAVIDLMSDIIAMARSRAFVFTGVDTSSRFRTRFSGMSVLTDLLRQQPATVRGLLAHARPDLLAALFEAPRPRPRASLRRFSALLGQWRWNFPARWISARHAVKLRLPLIYGR